MRIVEELEIYLPIHMIFELFKDEKNAVFLDSSLQNKLGSHSIIGLYPYLELINSETFTVNGEVCTDPYEIFIKEYLKENKDINDTDLPIVSGAIGYFSYDYGQEKNHISSRHRTELPIPNSILCFYDVFIIESHEKGKLYLVANGHTQDSQTQIASLKDILYSLKNHAFTSYPKSSADTPLQANTDIHMEAGVDGDVHMESNANIHVASKFSKEDYLKAISKMIHHIIEGDIYIVNMTHQMKISSDVNPYDFFSKLRNINPSPFGGYFNYKNFIIISSSPERFLKTQNGHVVTRPIKGTRKRGASAKEDQVLRQELLDSKKDKSELLMIVDLERNDLNKVCVPGTVQVTELFDVEEYATVFHLVSNISGLLREDLTIIDLIEATFPGGSITGAPKERAMEIIDAVERERRNIYTGSLGYITLDGNCDLNIIIRTALYHKGIYHLGVGGGITCESDLEFEHEETIQKAKAIFEALSP